MNLEQYDVIASPSLTVFDFFSIGPKGKIKKQVQFRPLNSRLKIFNLGFGDVDENGGIDDLVITDNNDSQKILATVALTAIRFLERYPDRYVYATGSTKGRSRLYRIGISKNLEEIQQTLIIYGYGNDKWEVFENGKNYEEFLAKLKK